MKTDRSRFYLWLTVVLCVAYLIDRATKYLAVHALTQPRELIAGILELRFVPNPDFFFYFSLPRGLMSTLIIGLMIVVVWVAVQEYHSKHDAHVAALLFMLIGADSNVADRFFYGHVIDFIRVPFWTVFNLADLYIIGGALVLGWLLLRRPEASYAPPKQEI